MAGRSGLKHWSQIPRPPLASEVRRVISCFVTIDRDRPAILTRRLLHRKTCFIPYHEKLTCVFKQAIAARVRLSARRDLSNNCAPSSASLPSWPRPGDLRVRAPRSPSFAPATIRQNRGSGGLGPQPAGLFDDDLRALFGKETFCVRNAAHTMRVRECPVEHLRAGFVEHRVRCAPDYADGR